MQDRALSALSEIGISCLFGRESAAGGRKMRLEFGEPNWVSSALLFVERPWKKGKRLLGGGRS